MINETLAQVRWVKISWNLFLRRTTSPRESEQETQSRFCQINNQFKNNSSINLLSRKSAFRILIFYFGGIRNFKFIGLMKRFWESCRQIFFFCERDVLIKINHTASLFYLSNNVFFSREYIALLCALGIRIPLFFSSVCNRLSKETVNLIYGLCVKWRQNF